MTQGAALESGGGGVSAGTRFRAPAFLCKFAALAIYVALLLSAFPKVPHAGVDAALRSPRQVVMRAVNALADSVGVASSAYFVRQGAFFTLTMLIAPWLILACLRRWRPGELGWRLPNAFGWRLLSVSFIVALPFIIWMAASPTFRPYYESQLKRGAAGFLTFYAVTMVGEHFLFHGVILAVLYPGARWPGAQGGGAGSFAATCTVGIGASSPCLPFSLMTWWRGGLRWLGLTDDRRGATGWRGMIRGLGVPDYGEWAVLASGVLFAMVHWGKDARELMLSLPGGIASAYLAYRTDTLATPLLLHLATAGTAYVLMTAWA